MNSAFRLLAVVGCLSISFADAFAVDSHAMGQEAKLPISFGVRMDVGGVFPTNDFVKGGHFDLSRQTWEYSKEREVHDFSDVVIQMNFGVRPDRWQARAYRNPYYGVGVAFPRFHDERLGKPVSFFGTYGARIIQLTNWLKLNYEINFGYSTNWNHYDRFKNPDNVAVGWKHNAHVSLFPYFKFVIPGGLDLKAGVSLTHFSNGATSMPNRGLNNYAASVALSYNLNDSENRVRRDSSLRMPYVPFHMEHDFSLTRSFRQIYYDGRGTNLSTQFVQYRYPIFAFSYAPMLRWSYRYRCGLSMDFMYDESVGAHADYVMDPADGKMYDRVWLGDKRDRFNFGLSVKNELIMYGFSFYLNIGYDIIHGDESLTRLYEVIGVKIHPWGPLYAGVGVRAAYLSKAQFIAWSLGYNLKGKPLIRRKNRATCDFRSYPLGETLQVRQPSSEAE
ncbi:MAG: hypothetical protein IKZ67_00190 [Paludibacteraceae bacterium]|nr:hypothetical protein [Paludibacteraceae bacterium]